ncbi:MAG TPA: hypothetical protein VK577_18245 [Bradyrhizobium sp.]|jgi:hypothetical protein|nr:hypothetical protein [Bradyrhizobium sp.]
MRVALIVVSMLVAATPSEASKSCMSRTEARQHFGTVYIYWHGKGHCWDATPPRRYHQIRKVQRQLQRKAQRQVDQPRWHDSMSKMPPNEEPVQKSWVNRWVDIEPPQLPMVERRADIAQPADIMQPADITQPEPLPIRKPGPMVTPGGVVMVIIIILLTLAVVMIFEGPHSRRNAR